MHTQEIMVYLLSIPIVLFSLTVHEVSHGYAAYKLGDPTASRMGRLTLNPLRHLDPIGAICMVLFRFGWARPVPIDLRYFKKPRRDFALSSIAGPISNLLLGLISGFLSLLCAKIWFSFALRTEGFWVDFFNWFSYFFFLSLVMNVSLAVFNLIPIPPLDGSRLLGLLLPPRAYYTLLRYERYLSLALMLFLLWDSRFGFGLVGRLVSFFCNGILSLLLKIPFLEIPILPPLFY